MADILDMFGDGNPFRQAAQPIRKFARIGLMERPAPGMMRVKGTNWAILFAILVGILACHIVAPGTPRPTPLSSSEFRVLELDTRGMLTDMHGDSAVGMDEDGELWLVNVRTADMRQLTNDGHYKRGPVLSDAHIAWIEEGEDIQLPGDDGRSKNTADVFVMDLLTGEQRRITDMPANRSHLRISGSWLVWQDNRNELRERRERYDIYAYDLSHDREIPIAVIAGNQKQPSIHGDVVVWSDNRDSPQIGTRDEGCHNLPDRHCDIYSYNLATGEEKLLAQTGTNNGSPAIHGDLVVWQQYLESCSSLIVLLDMGTGEQRDVGTGGRSNTRPLVSADHVVWAEKEPCDVGGFPRLLANRSAAGAFVYRLDTGQVRRLSNYVEAQTLLHDDMAVITEGCHMPSRRYALFLD